MKLSYFQKFAISLLRRGPVPKHLAVIMDGNRRFAKTHNIPIHEGHNKGFDSFLKLLQWGEQLGIGELTIFAFSIDNYKRNPQEVTHLMGLFREKLKQLDEDTQFIKKHEVQVRVCGDLSYCDPQLREALQKLQQKSQHHTRQILNVCFSYNFVNELEHAMESLDEGLSKEEFLNQLQTRMMVPNSPDILLRTSGEKRLSNFLLHQIRSNTLIYFIERKWPELNFWDFCRLILFYRQS